MTGTAVLTSPTAPPHLRTVPRRDLSWRGWRLEVRVDLMRWSAPMAAALCWAGTAVWIGTARHRLEIVPSSRKCMYFSRICRVMFLFFSQGLLKIKRK